MTFMTSQPSKKTVSINILPNISRTKDNQTMTFGRFIESNTRNTFVEKSYTKSDPETIPRSLPKKSKLSKSLDQ